MPLVPLKLLHRRFTNVPLRWVLVVPFVLQTVGAVALVGYLSYQSGQQAIADLSQRLLNGVADRTTLYLEKTLEVPHLVNQLNADAIRLGTIPGFETTDSKPLEKVFWAQLLRFPGVSTIAIANERGGMIGSGRSDQSQATVVYRTPQFAKGTFSTSLVNSQGRVTRTAVFDPNYDARTRPWYQTPARAGKATWSPIYQYVSSEPALGISAGLPIYTATGKLRGVLATDITLDKLNQFLINLQISPSGQVFIIERSGLLVASSTDQPPFISQSGELQRIPVEASKNSVIREVATQLTRHFGSFSQLGAVQPFDTKQGSARQFVQVKPFQDQYGLDWLIVLVVPESDFAAEIQVNNARTVVLCWFTLFVTTALGVLTARWIATPIVKLNQASQALAQGEWQESLAASTPIAELKTLTHSFNQTAAQLQRSLERTKLALYESEDKFAKIFRTSPDAISIISLASDCYIEVNDRFLSLTGYTREAIIGRTTLEIELFHQPEKVYEINQALKKKQSIQNYEVELRAKSGAIKTGLISSELIEIEGQSCILSVFKDYTGRKRAEKALREALQELTYHVDNSPLATIRWDREFRVESWSQQAEKIFGWTAAEVIGKTMYDWQFIHEDDLEYVTQVAVQLLQGSNSVCHTRNYRKDGSVVYCEWYNSVLLDDNGNLVSLLSLAQDVTVREQTAVQLRKTEQWLQQFSQQSPSNIYTIVQEPDGHLWFEYLSSAVESLHEFTREQVYQDAGLVIDAIYPDDKAGYEQAVLESMQTLGPFSYQWRIMTPSGLIKWLQANSQPERRPNGAIAWHGFVQDITDRKRMEEALRESEERFRLAFDDAAIGIALVTLDGQFLKVNRSLCEILGYSEAELLQHNIQTITHPDDLNGDLNNLQQLLNGEQRSYHLEKRYIHKQGYIIWGLLSVSAIRALNGSPLYLVGQVQDISDRHSAERVKNEFISVVSHELRTPLTSIRGSLGMLAAGVLDDEPETAKRMLQVALGNSERLVRLVNDILDLERLESGSVELVRQDCEAADLMHQAIEAVQSLADQAAITLRLTPISAQLWVNPDAIVQVLTNLLGNAIKFSPTGSTVWLSAEMGIRDWGLGIGDWEVKAEDREPRAEETQNSKFGSDFGEPFGLSSGQKLSRTADSPEAKIQNPSPILASQSLTPYLLFSITDQGRGIPSEKLETIFGRFQQVDASDSRQKGGTGLGLAICKSIVRQHGGEIWAESVLEQGSTFYFTVPLQVS